MSDYFNHRRRNAQLSWWQRTDSWGDPVWVRYLLLMALVLFCAFGYYYNAILH